MDSLSETLVALSKSTHGRMPTELRGLGALRSYARLATCSSASTAAGERRTYRFTLAANNFALGWVWSQNVQSWPDVPKLGERAGALGAKVYETPKGIHRLGRR